MNAATNSSKVRFGDWTLDRSSGKLTGPGAARHLPEKVQILLDCFLSNPDRVLSRQELKSSLWPEGVHVDFDNNLNTSLARLRDALGDSGRHPRYIETVPKRGYRWIGPAIQPLSEADPRSTATAAWIAAAFLLCVAAAALGWVGTRPPESQRLAVTPFEVVSGTDLEYLARGLTWDLVTELANWNPGRLEVIGQASSRAGTQPFPSDADVDYVVRGGVQARSGGRVQISAHLVRTRDNVTMWAMAFDRPEAEVMELQRAIAGRISEVLGLELARLIPEEEILDPAAREALLRGRYLLEKTGSDDERRRDLIRAAEEASAALSLEPESMSVLLLASDVAAARWPAEPDQLATAHEYLARALRVAPDHPETLIRRASYRFNLHWDFQGAEKDFRRALQLSPNEASYHASFAFYLSSRDRHDEAVSHLRRALELEPVSASVSGDLAWVYFQARRYEEAIEQAERTLTLEPADRSALQTTLLAQEKLGRRSEALQTARRLLEVSEVPETTIRRVLAAGSLADVWQLALDKLERTAAETHVHPASFALIHSQLAAAEPTLRYLKAALEEPYCSYLPFIETDPRLDVARGLEGFVELITSVQASDRPGSRLARMLETSGAQH